MRDDFLASVKAEVAARSGHRCSNPRCRRPTSGPAEADSGRVSVGVAAHISAAAPKGPRFSKRLTSEERRSLSNAIWLCQTCAKLIDSDAPGHPTSLLRVWKSNAEAYARVGVLAPTAQNEGQSPALLRAYALGRTLAQTEGLLKEASMGCVAHLRLALELWDLEAARKVLWDVALSVSHLSTAALSEIESAHSIDRGAASDYALFVCALPVYEAWSQAAALAESLDIGQSAMRELQAYRSQCFTSLQTRVRAVAAVSMGGHAAEDVSYNISSAYLTLARAVSSVATQRAGFAFYTGVAVGHISGALNCIASLSALCAETRRELQEDVVASIWYPGADAWNKLGEYAGSLGVDVNPTLGRVPSPKRLQSVGVSSCRSSIETCDELLSASLATS
jgi:hypothetical protein